MCTLLFTLSRPPETLDSSCQNMLKVSDLTHCPTSSHIR